MIETKSISEINEYVGSSVNPLATPEQMYELYSVPSFESGYPEVISGADIGSTKVTVEEGDVLICKINPRINRVWVVRHNTEFPLLASSEWIVIRNRKMNSAFLRWYFSSPKFRMLLTSQVTGMGGSLTRAQPKQVAKYPVPILLREKQDYIAEILDKVEILIEKRNTQLTSLDELVKSRFIELFGDPVDNEMQWPTKSLEEACRVIVDCPHSTPNYTSQNTGFMCIRTSIVKKNYIIWDDIEFISEEEYNKRIQRKKPEKGDVIYTREGAILGIAAVIDKECNVALGQRAMLLSPDANQCNSIFLCNAMNCDSFLANALKGQSGSASPHINVGDIKAFKMIMPPIKLQQQFAAFVAQVDKSKFVVQKSLQELETLKKSLMQEYFG